jgi:CubicO group peptidase (beta-lactamase class C family)
MKAHTLLALGSYGLSVLMGCGATDGPEASDEDIEHAKAIYTACVEEELGMEVLELEIEKSGDILVRFGDGYTEEGARHAIEICEARIAHVLNPGGGGFPVLGAPPNLGAPATDEQLGAFLTERVRMGFQGVLLAQFEGEARVDAGYGTLREGTSRAPDRDTAFDCGSIMKVVTAAVVFLLEDDGVLSRAQPLSDFFPQAQENYPEVTVQHVLTHSAGFDEYHDTSGDFEELGREDAVERILAKEPLFDPGTESAYSNSGFTLLAALIERVTGQAFQQVVLERVFEPLGMSRSGFYADARWEDDNVAIGRGADEQGENNPATWPAPTWALLGNGGLVSTPRDLLVFAQSIDGGPWLDDATRSAFHREYIARAPANLGSQEVLGYAGGNDFGFGAVVLQVPATGTYVVAASHVVSPISAEILGLEILQVLAGEVLELPAAP